MILVALLLGGCGSGSSETPPPYETPGNPPNPPPPPPAPAVPTVVTLVSVNVVGDVAVAQADVATWVMTVRPDEDRGVFGGRITKGLGLVLGCAALEPCPSAVASPWPILLQIQVQHGQAALDALSSWNVTMQREQFRLKIAP